MLGYGFGFDLGFSAFGILFVLVFLMIVGIFFVILIRGVSTWNKNNHSPRLTVPAEVVAKRVNVTHHHHAGHSHGGYHTTRYYVTFQVESGDRMELFLSGSEYGLLVEGDRGQLAFQGTRFLSFNRNGDEVR